MFNIGKLFSKYSNQRAIIWQSSSEHRDQYNYDEIIKASEILRSSLQELIKSGQSSIGVLLDHSAVIVPVILGILGSKASFCCLNPIQSPTELKEMIKLLRCHIGITDKDFMSRGHLQEYETFEEIKIFDKCLVVLRLSMGECDSKETTSCDDTGLEDILSSSKPMFSCSTSGTTGKPKMIQVPFKCLMPNVRSLSKYYGIVHSDVIYISSLPTFDPFVVDLFLGLFNGATILMVSNELRLSTNFLLSSFRTNSVTIMQITPSLFRRFTIEAIQNQLLSPSSTLRCLILGGEPFPSIGEVALWYKSIDDVIEMHTRLFNIYGITEVSCWSTIYEVTSMDINLKNLIPIGLPLDQYTTLKVVDCENKDVIENGIGELFIESKIRQCLICDDGQTYDSFGSTGTGDLVEIKPDGAIYYKTRVNNMVKIFGRKVNLTKIESATKSYWAVNDACCVYDKATKSLILFIQCRDGRKYTKKEILQDLREKLLEQEVPNEIHFVDEFPLSSHGKISKSKLLEMIEKQSTNSRRDYFVTKLEENLPAFNIETTLKLPFLAAGGSSVLALQLINEFDRKFNIDDQELITMLLNPDVSIEQILLHLQNCGSGIITETTPGAVQRSPFAWCHDLKKCIDASPIICTIDDKRIVSVGSHSHTLVNIDLASGQLLSELTLPDRIECQVVQYNSHGIVGCYDGLVYCFDIRNGLEKWKFNSNGMVKSKVCTVGSLVVIGNYNSEYNVWCVRADDGALIWHVKIGEKSIYAGIVEMSDHKLFIATLDGVCAAVEPSTGHCSWKTKLESPIFSTAKVLANTICVAEVLGIVHCIDPDSGKILCSFKAAGNIYSSIESIDENTICFGCHDKSIYCVSVSDDASLFKLLWKVETTGQIFASPKTLIFESMSFILACSTDGTEYY